MQQRRLPSCEKFKGAAGGARRLQYHRRIGEMYAASARARRAGSAAVMELMERRILWATTRFAVIGDYSAGAALREVSDVIKSWAPNVVATVGDNNYPDGARSSIDAN